MKEELITDIEWLKSTHLPNMPEWAKSALIIGNEDSPDEIRLFDLTNPLVDSPYMVYSQNESGEYIEESIYSALKKMDIPTSSWCSDLYFKMTTESIKIRNRFKYFHKNMTFSTFKSNNDYTNWIECPFHYDPYWIK